MSTDRKLALIQSDVRLSPDQFELEPRNPEVVRVILEDFLVYGTAVEQEVRESAAVGRLLSPFANDNLRIFQGVWEDQELGHGEILQSLANILDVSVMPLVDKLDNKMQFAGRIASKSRFIANVTELVYLAYGMLGEDETWRAYRVITDRLRQAGELDLYLLFQRITQQESRHRAYYIDAVIERSSKWNQVLTRSLARNLVDRLYQPVGVNTHDKDRLVKFGKLVIATAGDDYTDLTDAVEQLANKTLRTRPGFISSSYAKSVELAKVA